MENAFTHNGHNYQLVTSAKTWAEAKQYAEQQGGHLAIIESAAENTAISNYLSSTTFSFPTASDGGGAPYVWLGATDSLQEGSWVWSNGNPVSGYTNWGSGSRGSEPDNYLGSQDAMALGLSQWPYPAGGLGQAGQWNDINENNRVFSVIEWEPEASGTPTTVVGQSGIDTRNYAGKHADYIITKSNPGYLISNAHTSPALNESLQSIERLTFQDKKIALDLSPAENAGKALLFIGTLAHNLLASPAVLGTILSLFDQGKNLNEISQLAIDSGLTRNLAGSSSNQDLVKLAFKNVTGSEASNEMASALAANLQGSGGSLSQAEFIATVAMLDINQQHVGLVGLQTSGVEYL